MELRPYQREAADFLKSHPRAGLFDEQGLGKTPTTIVASEELGCERVLVLCESNMLYEWAHEFALWACRLDTQVVATVKGAADIAENPGVVVTTHGLLIQPRVFSALMRREWDLVIVDEVDGFRGRDSKRSRMLFGRGKLSGLVSRAARVWCLTGTPTPNGCAAELWPMLQGLWPERIDHAGFWKFAKKFATVYEGTFGTVVKGARNVEEFRERTRGLWMRRRQRDVLPLPDVRYGVVDVETPTLTPELIEALRKLDIPEERGGTAAALRRLSSADSENGKLRRMIGEAKVFPAVDLAERLLEKDRASGLVLFAWHRGVIGGIVAELAARGFTAEAIVGGTTARKKHELKTRFQNGELDVLVGQIRAAGSGITLTRAHRLVFVEMDFVPGRNAQAARRIIRYGQDRECKISILALRGTVDTVIQKTLRDKVETIHALLGETKR